MNFKLLSTLLSGGKLDGIKMLVGYILANFAAGYPLFVKAVNDVMSDPSLANILNVLAQGFLIWGGGHDIVKKALGK